MEPTVVRIDWCHGGDHVLVGGGFSNWRGIPMIPQDTQLILYHNDGQEKEVVTWELYVKLTPGLHKIKFVVDGSWCCDPEKELIDDGNGNLDNILSVQRHDKPARTLMVLRGPSGSGKTTMAMMLLKQRSGVFFEADQNMVNSDGLYQFNPKKLTSAHYSCQKNTEEAMMRNESLIVVSNTATQYWEMYEYVRLANLYGYNVEIEEPDTEWKNDPNILYEKNAHEVPLATIKNQLDNLKRNPTLPSSSLIPLILATGGIRPSFYRPGFNLTLWKMVYYALTESEITPYIELLKQHLGEEQYQLYNNKRRQRDGSANEHGNMYHITLTSFHPKDEELLTPEQLKSYFNKLKQPSSNENENQNESQNEGGEDERKLVFLGLGRAEMEGNVSYFIVVSWPYVNAIRSAFDLRPLDLHVTLGFCENDVQCVSKGADSIFLKI